MSFPVLARVLAASPSRPSERTRYCSEGGSTGRRTDWPYRIDQSQKGFDPEMDGFRYNRPFSSRPGPTDGAVIRIPGVFAREYKAKPGLFRLKSLHFLDNYRGSGAGCGRAIPVVPGGGLSAAVTIIGVRSNVVTKAAPKTAIKTAAKIRIGARASVCGLRGSFSMVLLRLRLTN